MTATQLSHGQALRPTTKVLPEHARGHNRSLVLQTLYRSTGLSRADIARETGLTRVTVSDLVSELIAEGLVVELGQREDARPGKPATLLAFARDAAQIIAVDLSDDLVFRGAVLDLGGAILSRAEVELGAATGEAAVEKVVSLIDALSAELSAELLGIGVGSPGIVERDGVVRAAPNLGWLRVDLQNRLAERFDAPVLVANDANAAVLAEYSFATSPNDLLLVKVGHGVGAGLLLGGRPVYGSSSAAGEIGHVVIGTDGGPVCACGKTGCLEAWLAVPRLSARLAALPEGDEAARTQILSEAGSRLGIILAPVVGALDLDEIVLSGPEELLDGALATAAIETIRTRMMAEFTGSLTLRMTSQGQDIVLRGAAVMVLSGRLGVS